ncbi:MAG TPA: threonine synthase [Planctomycetota bacterium]|nr:threonine synthase [Planctomycetota bacterium]
MSTEIAFQHCIDPSCRATFGVDEVLTACKQCGSLLDIAYDWKRVRVPAKLADFEKKWSSRRNPLHYSGVWRFKELLDFAPDEKVLTIGEGQTLFRLEPEAGKYTGVKNIFLQYEGMNPSGSFKDNGMTAGFTHARMTGAKKVACASTGNTSSSLAAYAAASYDASGHRLEALVFVGSGRIAMGKLSQGLDYGARTLQIMGLFDDAMKRVREVSKSLGIYLLNSVNPFRLEGQKTIMFRVLEALAWQVPDWIVVPGGNLGNSSAFAKAFSELKELGLIDRLPRLAVINAAGANTLNLLYNEKKLRWNGGKYDKDTIAAFYREMDEQHREANTVASAIEINRPVNLTKCLRALESMNGVVTQVDDQEILDAKAIVGRGGIGCEPASAASVAGTKKLVNAGVIGRDERVVCIITGHQLKAANTTVGYHSLEGQDLRHEFKEFGVKSNPYANRPIQVKNDLSEILRVIAETDHSSWDA